MITDTTKQWGIALLSLVTALMFWVFSGHIDFHPDEAIYFEAIPVNIRNDTGLFYIAFYTFMVEWFTGPEGARLASALLGAAVFALLAKSFRQSDGTGMSWPWLLLLFAAFVFSYQALFVFIRVRPEAAWWFCAVLTLFSVVNYRNSVTPRMAFWLVLLAALLLPMNHRLSWFACAYFGGFVLMFFPRDEGWRKTLLVLMALALGAVLNIILRAWWAGVPLEEAFRVAATSSPGSRMAVSEFFHYVFVGSPLFLNDMAQNANLYEWVTGTKRSWLSHAFLQNLFWGLMFVLPLLGRGWRERYLLGFPLFAFLAFWLSGYYNPTYSAGFSLFCVIALVYLSRRYKGWMQAVMLGLVAISVVNGISYIVTRVMNHGDATYFQAERDIRRVVESMPEGSLVAVPERFITVFNDQEKKLRHTVNYKQFVGADTDLLVIDSYDALMYHFVPDYEDKKKAMHAQAARMCLSSEKYYPVYRDDTMYEVANGPRAGSWFFRNSTGYTISVYEKCRTEQ